MIKITIEAETGHEARFEMLVLLGFEEREVEPDALPDVRVVNQEAPPPPPPEKAATTRKRTRAVDAPPPETKATEVVAEDVTNDLDAGALRKRFNALVEKNYEQALSIMDALGVEHFQEAADKGMLPQVALAMEAFS